MNTATEILQQIADSWAQSLGGKMPVRIQLAVESGEGAQRPYWGVTIGQYSDSPHWSAFRPDVESAKSEAERSWKLDGSPTNQMDIERAKLKERAKELGLRVVDS